MGRARPATQRSANGWRQVKLFEPFGTQPPCIVAMEACAGAHHWAREIGISLCWSTPVRRDERCCLDHGRNQDHRLISDEM